MAEDVRVALPDLARALRFDARQERLDDDAAVDALVGHGRNHVGESHLLEVDIAELEPALLQDGGERHLRRVALAAGHQAQALQIHASEHRHARVFLGLLEELCL